MHDSYQNIHVIKNTVFPLGGRSPFKILTGKPTGKRPLGRPRRRWEGNIRMDLEEISINAGKWVDLTQDMDY